MRLKYNKWFNDWFKDNFKELYQLYWTRKGKRDTIELEHVDGECGDGSAMIARFFPKTKKGEKSISEFRWVYGGKLIIHVIRTSRFNNHPKHRWIHNLNYMILNQSFVRLQLNKTLMKEAMEEARRNKFHDSRWKDKQKGSLDTAEYKT